MVDRSELGAVPAFGARRLLYVGTGSLNVAFMPYWVNWLRLVYPALDLRLMITRSAERFVTRTTLSALVNADVRLDAWPDDPEPKALHVELAEWPDAVIVQPATVHFVTRFALGLADTPVLLALLCTRAPVVVAPALPPRATQAPTYRQYRNALRERPNVAFVDPVPGVSATTRQVEAATAAPMPLLIQAAERLRSRTDGHIPHVSEERSR